MSSARQGNGNADAIHLFLRYPGGAEYPDGDTVTQATYTWGSRTIEGRAAARASR